MSNGGTCGFCPASSLASRNALLFWITCASTLGIADLRQVGQGGQYGRRPRAGRSMSCRRWAGLQCAEDRIQRALATLLGGELLGNGQLILEPLSGTKFRVCAFCTTALSKLPTRNGCGLHGQGGAGHGVIEHGHQRTVDRRLRGALGQHLVVSTLACNSVPSGICVVSMRVRAATLALKACCRLRVRLPVGVWLTATLLPSGNGWGCWLAPGLATTVEGQLEQQLKGITALFEGDHFGVRGFSRVDQPDLRLQQFQQCSRRRRGACPAAGVWKRRKVDLTGHRARRLGKCAL
jgi:hypothetical protein